MVFKVPVLFAVMVAPDAVFDYKHELNFSNILSEGDNFTNNLDIRVINEIVTNLV